MKAKVKYLDQLLDAVCDQCRVTKNHFGLAKASEKIGLREDYLYKHIYDKIKSKQGDSLVGIGSQQLADIILFLGYRTFESFIESCEKPLSDILLHAKGNYYCYVRENSDDGYLLRSPARISIEDRLAQFELRGPKWTYQGLVNHVNGCLFITMTSHSGKSFHHVYKIGSREAPEVLCGAFTGVSTAFDPIGGRTVLTRSSEEYESMKPQRIKILSLSKSASVENKLLAKYFRDRSRNNLIVPRPVTFRHSDLKAG